MNSFEWTFVWDTQCVGLFSREQSGWILQGRKNASPDTGWIIAHDVFHHRPDDTGSYTDEICSFGGQTWLETLECEADPEAFSKSLADSLIGVMGLVIENGSCGAEGLLLKEIKSANEHPMAHIWHQAYQIAIIDAKDEMFPFGEKEVWEKLDSAVMADRAVAYMAKGYEAAKLRWPDAQWAREQFTKVQLLATNGIQGERLIITIQDKHMEALRHPPGYTLKKKQGIYPH